MDDLKDLNETSVTLKVRRDEKTIPLSVTPVKDESGTYKLGIWVRDDTQGIGTLTYVDENGRYGALGHGTAMWIQENFWIFQTETSILPRFLEPERRKRKSGRTFRSHPVRKQKYPGFNYRKL